MRFKLLERVELARIVNALGLKSSTGNEFVDEVSNVACAGPQTLCFAKDLEMVTTKVSGAVVVVPEHADNNGISGVSLIHSQNPRLDFVRILEWLDENVGFAVPDIPPVIHPTAKLGRNVVIEDGCMLAEGVVIGHNTVIHRGTRIGKYSKIQANCTIGGDGFGYERMMDGTPVRFPHLGCVKIGDYVEIGSNTCVDRGTLGDTVIEDHAKIDNLVHIAHNCHIGYGAFVIAGAVLGGGVKVEKLAWLGPNCSILQKLTIGTNSLVGLGAVVVKHVPVGQVFAGNPARFFKNIE